jgi:RNA polymerase sigma factor (sigma-70 family)
LLFLRSIPREVADDAKLINEFRQTGNLSTLATLYEQYMDLCYAVCLKYLKDAALSQDAVMDIFEELGGLLRRHEVRNFRGWLYAVTRTHCLMKLRADKQKNNLPLEEKYMQSAGEMHQEDMIEREGQLEKMQNCINRLVDDQRIAIEMFYKHEKCYNEISEITGFDWNKVRSLIQNGRRNLKACMESTFKMREHGNTNK